MANVFICMAIACWAFLVLWMPYNISNRFHCFVRRLFGATIIEIKGVSSAVEGDRWRAVLETDAWGVVFAYRYPATKIGFVRLDDGGTGHWCGDIVWRALR